MKNNNSHTDTNPSKDTEWMISLDRVYLEMDSAQILNGVSFQAKRDEIVTIIGPSGTGKTTMLKVIAGLIEPDNGSVHLASERIGLAFQFGALFTSLSIEDNLAYVLFHTTDLSDSEVGERIESVLKMVDLYAERSKYPSELSGGMQKRVGIARALAIQPDIMLYDEPSSGLDPIMASKLESDLRKINHEFSMCSLVVSHELSTIESLSDRVLMLYQGKIVYSGSVEDFMNTEDPYAYQFRNRKQVGPIHF